MNKDMEAQAWLAFASAAVAGYEMPDEVDDDESLSDDICDIAVMIADKMIAEFDVRYGTKPRGGRERTPPKRRRGADEEDE